MPLSKVKRSKQQSRLEARQASWAAIPAADKTGKSGRLGFTKPGSMKR